MPTDPPEIADRVDGSDEGLSDPSSEFAITPADGDGTGLEIDLSVAQDAGSAVDGADPPARPGDQPCPPTNGRPLGEVKPRTRRADTRCVGTRRATYQPTPRVAGERAAGTARLRRTVIGALALVLAGPVGGVTAPPAVAAPPSAAAARPGAAPHGVTTGGGEASARERAEAVAARVDRLTAEYRRHSAASAVAAAALASAYARVSAADDASLDAGARLARVRAEQSRRALTLYAYGAGARPGLTLLTAESPDDGLWRLSVGAPIAERLLASAARDERAARAELDDAATGADDAASAAGSLARALGTLHEEEAAAQQALETARAELNRLDAEARREEAAREAEARLDRAGSDADTATLESSTRVTAIGIPAEFEQAYRAAAPTCPGMDWTLLAAVGQIESGHGRNNGPSSAGAIGPMQFMPATFAAYGVDGDGDGRIDAWDPQDAIFTAARYLCVNGAGTGAPGVRRALFAYNHAEWYVELVLAARTAIAARAGA